MVSQTRQAEWSHIKGVVLKNPTKASFEAQEISLFQSLESDLHAWISYKMNTLASPEER